MTKSLWPEMTIAGAIYFAALLLFVARVIGVHDLSSLEQLRGYAALVTVALAAGSCLSGILAHRLLTPLLRPIVRLLQLVGVDVVGLPSVYWTEKLHVTVLQEGSTRLNQEIDLQFSMLALFRLLCVAFPLLGVCWAYWSTSTLLRYGAVPVLAGAAQGGDKMKDIRVLGR